MIAEANKTFPPQWPTTRRPFPRGVAATRWKRSSCETNAPQSGRSEQSAEQLHIMSSQGPAGEKVRKGAPLSLRRS